MFTTDGISQDTTTATTPGGGLTAISSDRLSQYVPPVRLARRGRRRKLTMAERATRVLRAGVERLQAVVAGKEIPANKFALVYVAETRTGPDDSPRWLLAQLSDDGSVLEERFGVAEHDRLLIEFIEGQVLPHYRCLRTRIDITGKRSLFEATASESNSSGGA